MVMLRSFKRRLHNLNQKECLDKLAVWGITILSWTVGLSFPCFNCVDHLAMSPQAQTDRRLEFRWTCYGQSKFLLTRLLHQEIYIHLSYWESYSWGQIKSYINWDCILCRPPPCLIWRETRGMRGHKISYNCLLFMCSSVYPFSLAGHKLALKDF